MLVAVPFRSDVDTRVQTFNTAMTHGVESRSTDDIQRSLGIKWPPDRHSATQCSARPLLTPSIMPPTLALRSYKCVHGHRCHGHSHGQGNTYIWITRRHTSLPVLDSWIPQVSTVPNRHGQGNDYLRITLPWKISARDATTRARRQKHFMAG